MKWDDITLAILAASGSVTLLLAQIDDVLAQLPRLIRAWRRVRREMTDGRGSQEDAPSEESSVGGDTE
ncbi:hypothetical protein ACWDR3_01215 [Streptomyces sp. NPDC001002]